MGNESKISILNKAIGEIEKSKGFLRLKRLFDEGSFTQIDAFAKSEDSYAEAAAGFGLIDGALAYAFAQNSDLSGGAMSQAQAAKIKKIFELAEKTGAPVVGVYDSIGGRLSEGTELMAAYGDILKLSSELSGVVPQISVVLGPCLGTQAIIAACADIVIVSEGAELSLDVNTGSTAETAVKDGTAHILAKDGDEALETARRLVSLLPSNNIKTSSGLEFEEAPGSVSDDTPALKIPELISDGGSFIELSAEYGKEALTALATLTGTAVGLAVLDSKAVGGDSCKKLARFIRFCDAFSIPVITLVNAEKFCCLKSAARVSSAYAEATTAKLTLITGEAYGALYTAVAGTGSNCDLTLAYPTASVSPLNPAAAAVIMLGEDYADGLASAADPIIAREELVADYKEKKCSVFDAAAKGYVQDIIKPSDTRARLASAIYMLLGKRVHRLPKKHNNLFV